MQEILRRQTERRSARSDDKGKDAGSGQGLENKCHNDGHNDGGNDFLRRPTDNEAGREEKCRGKSKSLQGAKETGEKSVEEIVVQKTRRGKEAGSQERKGKERNGDMRIPTMKRKKSRVILMQSM